MNENENEQQAVPLSPESFIDWDGFRKSKFASDAQGHSIRLSFRIQPQTVRVLHELVAEYGEEYKEIGDLIRHAVREHIVRLTRYRTCKQADRVTSTMAQVDSMLTVFAFEEDAIAFSRVMDTAAETVQKLFQVGAHGEVAKILHDMKREIERMTSPYWRQRYAGELRERFGSLEASMSGLDLTINWSAALGDGAADTEDEDGDTGRR